MSDFVIALPMTTSRQNSPPLHSLYWKKSSYNPRQNCEFENTGQTAPFLQGFGNALQRGKAQTINIYPLISTSIEIWCENGECSLFQMKKKNLADGFTWKQNNNQNSVTVATKIFQLGVGCCLEQMFPNTRLLKCSFVQSKIRDMHICDIYTCKNKCIYLKCQSYTGSHLWTQEKWSVILRFCPLNFFDVKVLFLYVMISTANDSCQSVENLKIGSFLILLFLEMVMLHKIPKPQNQKATVFSIF